MEKPIVNSWTEFGDLELVCVGSVIGANYPEQDLACSYNRFQNKELERYVHIPVGSRPEGRVKAAEAELENLIQLLQGESITVQTVEELDQDINKDLLRKRSTPTKYIYENGFQNGHGRSQILKNKSEVIRPPIAQFDHLLITPWWRNIYQFGNACPRDCVITLGNTILEAPTGSRVRYFESAYHRPNFYPLWKADKRIHWKAAPQPTCGNSMYDFIDPSAPFAYKTPLNDSEVAFDAADLMRCGKDIFYKRSETANNLGIQWLRKEFPDLRFHMLHFPTDLSPHIDVSIAFLRPPTSGSAGIVLFNQLYPPLKSEMNIFIDNDWNPMFCPLPATMDVSPVAICSPGLNMNFLSLSPNCIIIEECEVPLYHFLDDLGFDVITAPLRKLNEFGGGLHCVTWDIRRNDSCKDYFPIQDYDGECQIDLENFTDVTTIGTF